MAVKIGINGFGRIGGLVYRAGYKNPDLEFVAAKDIMDGKIFGHLLKYDSIHGVFPGEVKVQGDSLLVDGKKLQIFAERDPANLPWKKLGVDIVVESTGLFKDKKNAAKHITASANKALISAPPRDPEGTSVIRVNKKGHDPKRHDISTIPLTSTTPFTPLAWTPPKISPGCQTAGRQFQGQIRFWSHHPCLHQPPADSRFAFEGPRRCRSNANATAPDSFFLRSCGRAK